MVRFHLWLCLALTVALGRVVADDVGLVRVGDVWSWNKPTPAVPWPGWQQPGCPDQGWARGSGGFGLDYYAYEATVLPYQEGDLPTFLLRREFVVAKPEDIAWLTLRLDYSGGFVAWLNGHEIARRGFNDPPGVPVPPETYAAAHYRGTPELIDVSAAQRWLCSGTNTLALEWHLAPGHFYGSGEGLVPELVANFTRGPFLQDMGTDHVWVLWRTGSPTIGTVEYGPSDRPACRVAESAPATNHAVLLTNLTAHARYVYRVTVEGDGRIGRSPWLPFRTFSESGPVRFTVAADVGSGALPQLQIAAVMAAAKPDLMLFAGDLVYPYYNSSTEELHFLSVYARQMLSTPLFAVAGNHDVVYYDPAPFLAAFHPPTNNVSPEAHALARTGPSHYYSFDHGDVHFVGLYVPLMETGFDLLPASPQLAWLEADLAATRKPWRILFLHHPVMTSGPHAADDYNSNQKLDPGELGELLLPVAQRHGVQLILAGHDHDYERFQPVGGVYQVISAGGGGRLYQMSYAHPASARFASRYNCLSVTVAKDELQVEALDERGSTFDSMVVRRVPPPAPAEYQARPASPAFPANLPDDRDGNLAGQRFDFPGPALPTAGGRFSNLGQAQFAYDATNLYFGFARSVIGSDAYLVLFLGNPRQPGVTNLSGLGNLTLDPSGQGADGLDFLTNLAFANFAPTVACLLGDEFADGQARSFIRTNRVSQGPLINAGMTNVLLPVGQGIFRLQPGFPDVPGTLLQQCSDSPQTSTATFEQNADFIMGAIPLAELGLREGGLFEAAAMVVKAALPDDGARLDLTVDSAYLGAALAFAPDGTAALSPIRVRLLPPTDADGDGLDAAEEIVRGTDPGNPDTDADGLPDGWEIQHGLDPLDATADNGAGGDPDGDGLTNGQEWRCGTDPEDPRSGLALLIHASPSGILQLGWAAVPGRLYQLQMASDARGPFIDLAAPTLPRRATSGWETFDVGPGDPSAREPRYYRLRLAE